MNTYCSYYFNCETIKSSDKILSDDYLQNTTVLFSIYAFNICLIRNWIPITPVKPLIRIFSILYQ